jgi:transcriptional regulator PpsR
MNMIDEPGDRPDITLTLDRDGVIRDVAPSVAFESEALDRWCGRPWGETLPPELVERVGKAMSAKPKSGESHRFQTLQLLPSGRELQVEYTTVSLGKNAGFVAIGRNLENVSDLQTRLVDAQKAREQDFWRLREVEQRYRAVFDATDEAMALVRASNRRVVEINVQATRALGLLPGAEFFPDLSARDRKALDAALELARSQGRAPNIVLHLPDASQWSLRASLLTSDSDAFYLLQMSALGATAETTPETYNLDQIWRRLPDAFVLVDRDGAILKTNSTFLDLAQVGVEAAALGQNIRRWLSHPGEDFPVIADLVRRHGSVRMLRCRLEGDLGSMTPVEISAVGDQTPRPKTIGLVMRDVSPRESHTPRGSGAEHVDLAHGLALPKDSLEAIVEAVVETIERRAIEEALAKRQGNRTLAARYLGLSRQTLHVKLKKYKLDRA